MSASAATTVADLFRTLDRDRVLDRVTDIDRRPHQRAGYERAWAEIATLVPVPSTMVCRLVDATEDDEEGNRYPSALVEGVENGEAHAIEYLPWERWLGMTIDSRIGHVDPEDILAHILREMTWAGYARTEVARALEAIDRR